MYILLNFIINYMTETLPRKLVATLNNLGWAKITNDRPSERFPATELWTGPTGYEDMETILEEIRASGTGIKAQQALSGDCFCVAFPVSELRALADNGVRFARTALKKPETNFIDPPELRARA